MLYLKHLNYVEVQKGERATTAMCGIMGNDGCKRSEEFFTILSLLVIFWLSAYDSDNAKHNGYLLPQCPLIIYYPHRKHVASKMDKICGKCVYSWLATYIQDEI
jgi:hypothetical protein